MTKPATRIDIAFNATYATAAASRVWTDVTDYVLTANGININHGRQDEHSQPGPDTCSLTLNNSDGRFTPDLASSPYYPNVKIGRPLRVSTNLNTFGDFGTFEADANNWTGTNATAARTTAQANSGSASLSVTATSAANIAAQTPAGTSGIPVLASTPYRASAWVRTAVTGRTTDVRILWYDSGGALISTSDSANVTDSTTWQKVELTATSPSNAAYVRVQVVWVSAAIGEVHYVDDVRLDVDRFTGYIDEWPLEWPGVVGTFATTAITASSRMARHGLSDKLKSVIEQEILADSPVAYYTLGEAEGATEASDSSGNSREPLTARGSGAAVTFGTAIGPSALGMTAATFTGGKWLQADCGTTLLTGSNASVACAFTASTASDLTTILAVGPPPDHTDSQSYKYPGIWLRMAADGSLQLTVPSSGGLGISIFSSAEYDDGAMHVAVATYASGTYKLYVDGVQVASATDGVGSVSGNSVAIGKQFSGSVAHAAVYVGSPVLSATEASDLYDAAATGLAGEPAHERLARYASYAGIPAAEYSFSTAAVTPMAHIDTTGKGVVELMQTVATTDGGVLYDGRDGVLTYVDRAVRYNATAAVTLDAAGGTSGIRVMSYSPKLDRSALINKMTATLSDGTYSVTAENTASSTEYGAHGPGDLELATTSNDEAHAAAWWRVNTYGEPRARAPQISVELAKMTPAQQVQVLALDVSDKITVTNLPSQSDASSKSFFVEGYTETITDSLHRIDFNVSPTAGFEVWEIGHATYGQYDAYPIAY